MIKIAIIIGSIRENRFGDKPALWLFDLVKKRDGVEVELLDLRNHPLPLFSESISPSRVKDGAYANDAVRAWARKISEADAFIFITPEYNHSIPGVLKNALDHLYAEWNNKPAAFVSYGSVGGARAVEHGRAIAVELQTAPIRNAVHIPAPWNLLDEHGNIKDDAFAPFEKSANALLDQLVWWAHALKTARS